MFVWVPAFCTILLSFTKWDGHEARNVEPDSASRNYWSRVHGVRQDKFFPAAVQQPRSCWCSSPCAALVGVLFAYLLDKNMRGSSAIYQSIFYMPVVLSLAIVGFIWKGVMYSAQVPGPVQRHPRPHRPGRSDRLGRQRREDSSTFHLPGLDTSTSGSPRTSPPSSSPWRGVTSAT